MTYSKTKDFKFNLENKNLLQSVEHSSNIEKKIGRPKKNEIDKLTKQITIKFKSTEMSQLQDIYYENHINEYSFGNFLRLIILKQLKDYGK